MASPKSDLTPTCSNCFYAVEICSGLECRRYAPRPSLERDDWEWPFTRPTAWCGEHRPNAVFLPVLDYENLIQ